MTTSHDQKRLETQLLQMRLGYIHENYGELARKAAEQHHSHVDYLAQVVDGEFAVRAHGAPNAASGMPASR